MGCNFSALDLDIIWRNARNSASFYQCHCYLLVSVVPIYLTLKLKDNLRKLTLILTIFILTHAIFHIAGFLGFNFLGEGVFEPLPVAGTYILRNRFFWIHKEAKTSMKSMAIVWIPATVFLIIMSNITVILLLIALGIFVWLAAIFKER